MSPNFSETLRFLVPVAAIITGFMFTAFAVGLGILKYLDDIVEFVNSAVKKPFANPRKNGDRV